MKRAFCLERERVSIMKMFETKSSRTVIMIVISLQLIS